MTSRVIKTVADRDAFIALLNSYKLPCSVTITKGKRRSIEQNRLQWLWLNEAAEQLGEYSVEEYRAFCKLHFGIPILRSEDADFRREYNLKIMGRYTYEEKLQMMIGPKIEIPVTRLMTTGQKKRYLDEIWHHFTNLGVVLTDPENEYGESNAANAHSTTA